jgi:hypothetical protein
MVLVQHLPPLGVPQSLGVLRRPHDVSEEHRGQHPLRGGCCLVPAVLAEK